EKFGDVVLSYTMVQQFLIAPDSPYLGEHAQTYREAIAATRQTGNLYSGMRLDLFFPLFTKIGPTLLSQPQQIFLDSIRRHPKRYLAGLARTAILYGGAKGQNSDNFCFVQAALSATTMGNRNQGGSARNQTDFTQACRTSFLMDTLFKLDPWYRYL